MDTTSVRLIRVDDAIHFAEYTDCRVDYRPSIKYRLEKPNAFDPSLLHRRGPWHEDEVRVTFILAPYLHAELLAFLVAPGQLYLEFTLPTNRDLPGQPDYLVLQLPVICSALPPLSDDHREYPAETAASFISRYSTPPDAIDWDTYEIPDGLEEIFP